MLRFTHRALLAAAALNLIACGAPLAPAPASGESADPPSSRLGRLVEDYWAESAALTPWYAWGGADMPFGTAPAENIAPQSLADALAIERRYLALLTAVPRSGLDPEAALTYDIFKRERSLTIAGSTYPAELLPVNPYDGMPLEFAAMSPVAERLALSSNAHFQQWRARASSFVEWTNQAMRNMRDGMRRGYTVPRILIEKSLPTLAALGEDAPANFLYQALRTDVAAAGAARPAKAAADAERERLAAAVGAVLKEHVLPSYRTLHDFLQREYLPRARSSVGWSALPLGTAWYAHLVERTTGDAATPQQLHALGLAEVGRIQQRIQTLLTEAGFTGDARSFAAAMHGNPRYALADAALLPGAYQELKGQVADAAPGLFTSVPRADFEIRKVEAYRESVTPALSYRPRAPNGLSAAVLYVNTAQGAGRVSFGVPQYLSAAVPGRHYQLELPRERPDLPRFRRFGRAPAFVEGWALYAATLGDELGVYRDPEAKFAALLAELNCALGLVTDTGLHSQGWSRQQAVDYLRAAAPDSAAEDSVDREIALPAAALACSVGFLKIQALRALAQQAQGAGFELRAFHTEVLRDGAMPLDVLTTKIKTWMQATAAPVSPPGGNSN